MATCIFPCVREHVGAIPSDTTVVVIELNIRCEVTGVYIELCWIGAAIESIEYFAIQSSDGLLQRFGWSYVADFASDARRCRQCSCNYRDDYTDDKSHDCMRQECLTAFRALLFPDVGYFIMPCILSQRAKASNQPVLVVSFWYMPKP